MNFASKQWEDGLKILMVMKTANVSFMTGDSTNWKKLDFYTVWRERLYLKMVFY